MYFVTIKKYIARLGTPKRLRHFKKLIHFKSQTKANYKNSSFVLICYLDCIQLHHRNKGSMLKELWKVIQHL